MNGLEQLIRTEIQEEESDNNRQEEFIKPEEIIKIDEQDMLYLEALSRMEGIGRQTLFRLLKEAGSPLALWEAEPDFLTKHLPEKKRQTFLAARKNGLNHAWLEQIKSLGIRLISCLSPLYPPLLREIHNPPAFLYVQGRAEVLRNRSLAVVGTRKASEYGRQVTNQLIAGLKFDHITIVSGLAEGIDTAAHWAALHHGLPTVAVFGCGLDIIYPTCNRKLSREILENGGALLSEYPVGMPPTQYTFPQRNRIVAGLSQGLLLVECDVKSGALITARLAVEEGRTVFAVPGNIFNAGSQGPATLLKHGAVPVTCVEDILQELHWETADQSEQQPLLGVAVSGSDVSSTPDACRFVRAKEPSPKSLTIPEDLGAQERTVLEAISGDPISLDDLQQTTGLPSAKISGSLTLLELDGLVVLLPGARVCRRLT